MLSSCKLILFDFDGTLVQTGSTVIPSDARRVLAMIEDLPKRPFIGIAANLPGPALHEYSLASGYSYLPSKYPTVREEEYRLRNVAGRLGISPQAVHVSFALQFASGRWVQTPHEHASDPRWARNLHKPQPGLVLKAMSQFGVKPTETLLVGHPPVNSETAARAGCLYLASLSALLQLLGESRGKIDLHQSATHPAA